MGRRRSVMRYSVDARGFTLLETVLVLGILGAALALLIPVGRQFHLGSLLDAEAQALASDLVYARSAAVAGLSDADHGVHVEASPTDQWVRFRGSTYAAGAPGNDVHLLPGSVDITSVTLNGGGNDIVFRERRGTTATAGSVVLRSPSGETHTISVNAEGVVTVQSP